MRYLNSDFVEQEILDTISLMQLNNEFVPELSGDHIHQLAVNFIFEWNEVGDYEANFDQTLRQFLTYEFATF